MPPTTPTPPGRVAVLSDIHGALPALEAVLVEPEVSAAERIVIIGDIAAGPQPAKVLDLLTGLGDRAVLIGGNVDRELVEPRSGKSHTTSDAITTWASGRLRDDQIALLAGLPLPDACMWPVRAMSCSATRVRATTKRSCGLAWGHVAWPGVCEPGRHECSRVRDAHACGWRLRDERSSPLGAPRSLSAVGRYCLRSSMPGNRGFVCSRR